MDMIPDMNLLPLVREIEWLESIVMRRFEAYFDQTKEMLIESITAVELDDKSNFGNKVQTWELNTAERIVLALVIAPYVKPEMLDIFYTKNSVTGLPYTEFGGITGKFHRGFIPTGFTVLFLLAGSDIEKRMMFEDLIFNRSVLFKQGVIQLMQVEHGEPPSGGALILQRDVYHSIIDGSQPKADFSASFPAKYITTALNWSDLILENYVIDDIQEIKTWIENGEEVMQQPNVANKLKPGYRSLFYGPPGTGKTLTACLLGKYTNKDVYRIDLSMLVSKYIGETEKNLSAVFELAENKKWILFFDEADALFGKRTQTVNSNDRYANQEVSYLLQKIEDYPGVIILATNLKSNMDEAFSRRFQSVINFPLPSPAQRLLLWKNIFQDNGYPVAGDVTFNEVAKSYALSGGAIINILRYCILAMIRNERKEITMPDILKGIKKELQKEGKTL